MKKWMVATASAIALCVSGAAFAASKGETKVELQQAAKLAGHELKAGNYKVAWEGEGDDVTVTLGKGRNKVEAKAKVVERENGETGVVMRKAGDGSYQVTEIRVDKKTSLVLADS
jgi:hypothetical protein